MPAEESPFEVVGGGRIGLGTEANNKNRRLVSFNSTPWSLICSVTIGGQRKTGKAGILSTWALAHRYR